MVPARQKDVEVFIVQESDPSTCWGQELIRLIAQLEMPELCFEERLDITLQLRVLFGVMQELEPMLVLA